MAKPLHDSPAPPTRTHSGSADLRPPSVDLILRDSALQALCEAQGRHLVKRAVDQTLADLRSRPQAFASQQQAVDWISATAQSRLRDLLHPRLSPVINLTGTVIHTNLGRALMSQEVAEAVVSSMTHFNPLEFDLETGERGDRDQVVEALLCRITGAESATIVNNCAAAVLLSLVALGARKEVIISRGEQIEIGGAFRMPDIMRAANCRLVEVGTTNRTHLKDYAEAVSPKSALIVKAHRSNYAVTGFTAEVGDEALAGLAHDHGLFYMVDLGSGALIDFSAYGLPREPLPSDALKAGADVVMFSGDKLLGGPQAGIIVGSRAAIQKIKKHPMKRVLRVSKLVMAALEASLRIYDSQHRLVERLPVLAMLSRSPTDISAAAHRLLPHLLQWAGESLYRAEVVECLSQIGSGAQPEERLPSFGVRLVPVGLKKNKASAQLQATLSQLRQRTPPIVGRIRDDGLIFDCRCLMAEDERLLGIQPAA